MAISKLVRDRILVEARHRCTICSEKCFEIHHIIEQADGGTDEPENLIVLCPNCHQHRYHRNGEFTRDQIRLYKEKLKDKNEIERRLLQNIDEIRGMLPSITPEEVEQRLREELQEAAGLISLEDAPALHGTITQTSTWLAERDLIRGGARKAIEIEYEIRKAQEKAKYPVVSISRVDEDAFSKAPDFPDAYYFVLILDRRPNRDWIAVFDVNYKNSLYLMKRKTTLTGDRITMIVAHSDDLQAHADFAKRLVQETNQTIHGRGFQIIDRNIEQEKNEALRRFDAIQSMKARVKNIKL